VKLAEKILHEKLSPNTRTALSVWGTKAAKDAASLGEKTAKDIALALTSIAQSIEEKDEKGALEDIKKLNAKIKKLDIEG